VIELDAVVPIAGVAPVTARLRAGEIVRLTGPAPACAALLDVIAGRRAPRAGAVRRDPRAVPVLVRAGEVAPPASRRRRGGRVGGAGGCAADARWRGGVDAAAALAARGAAVAGAGVADRRRGAAGDRGGGRGGGRGGAGRRGRGRLARRRRARARRSHDRADRERGRGAAAPARSDGPRGARDAVARDRRARGPRGAAAPAAWGLAAVAAAWLALAAWVIAAHQGYWTAAGSGAALVWLARLGAIGAAVIAATATAARARGAGVAADSSARPGRAPSRGSPPRWRSTSAVRRCSRRWRSCRRCGCSTAPAPSRRRSPRRSGAAPRRSWPRPSRARSSAGRRRPALARSPAWWPRWRSPRCDTLGADVDRASTPAAVVAGSIAAVGRRLTARRAASVA
jgi:hypothetical protein